MNALSAKNLLSRRQVLGTGVGLSAAALTLGACATDAGSTSSVTAPPAPTASPVLPKTIANAQEAADAVLSVAAWGATSGSYGIASILVENATGRLVAAQANSVDRTLAPDTTVDAGQIYSYDATEHGERKMAYWYFENRSRLSLPSPRDLTIITSLDPCAMCAGTLLATGFNVGVLAIDDFAGINYTSRGTFQTLPEPLRGQALARFGYYAADGGRAYQGSSTVAFARTEISQASLDEAHSVYEDNTSAPRSAHQASNTDPSGLTDPATDAQAASIRTAYQKYLPQAFTIKVPNYREPTTAVKSLLQELLSTAPEATNAVALLDSFGNVVCAAADSFDTNPVATCFQNVVQTYMRTRFDLLNSAATAQIANTTLTSPVNGTFVFLHAPSMRVATDYANVGAYGSVFGGPAPVSSPSPFQYFLPPQRGTTAEMYQAISQMAPLYSQHIKINPQKVST